MKNGILKWIVLLCLFISLVEVQGIPSAKEIIIKANDIIYPQNSIDTLEMISIKSKKKENIYKMKRNRKTNEKILIEFYYPPSEVKRKFLRDGTNLWMYLPNIGRAIRISPKQTYMGGDFSNADMLRINLIDDYVPNLIGIEIIEGKECYLLDLKAKDKSIAYEKVKYWVEKETYFPLKQEFYTGSGKLIKILSFSLPKLLAGKQRPTRLEMKNLLLKEYRTIVEIKDIEEGIYLPVRLFSPENLKEE